MQAKRHRKIILSKIVKLEGIRAGFRISALCHCAFRGEKVMIARDLASEFSELVANCDWFNTLKHSSTTPYAFTEHGIA